MNELLAKYQDVISTPPAAGDILTTLDGSPVVMTVQVEEEKLPFIYGRAYVSEVLSSTLGWYLRGVDDDRAGGWKCVLMTKARREALEKCKVTEDKFEIKSLKIVRLSSSGKSLLCEVHEYLPELAPPEDAIANPDDEVT